MPRRSAAAARDTRRQIVARALDRASVEGLEGLTIGRLADELGMSKAGVVGHFGSKEGLQLAVVDAARESFTRDVWEPVADEPPGLRRLLAACEAWIADVIGRYPGGCFFTAAAAEFDGRPGPVRDEVAAMWARWQRTLEQDVAAAIEAGEIPPGEDPQQLAFELRAIVLGLNQSLQLAGDGSAPERARRAVRRVLGVTDSAPV
jgi:AcrR family transcriptional regulator